VAKLPPKLVSYFGVTAAIGTLVCCGGITYYAFHPLNGIRVDRLKADLNQSLPDGSSWEQAEAWFGSHGFRPLKIAEKGGRIVGLGAQVPNDDLIESATIYIYLYFDTEGHLEKRTIYREIKPFL
jgi:hypothetical protein